MTALTQSQQALVDKLCELFGFVHHERLDSEHVIVVYDYAGWPNKPLTARVDPHYLIMPDLVPDWDDLPIQTLQGGFLSYKSALYAAYVAARKEDK